MSKSEKLTYLMQMIKTSTGYSPKFQRTKGAKLAGVLYMDLPEWACNLENLTYGIGYDQSTQHIADFFSRFFVGEPETGCRMCIYEIK